MTESATEEVLGQHRARIEAFVVRARRVADHSLLVDRDQFRAWASGSMELDLADEIPSLTVHVPPEEAFESLAARCRPLILQGEPCHHNRVLGSLRAFLKHDPKFGPGLEQIAQMWKEAVTPPPGTGFAIAVGGSAGDATSFADLAESWLYGDLVHALPDAQAKGADHTLNNRFSAAVLLYGRVAMSVVSTLNLIGAARNEGVLKLAAKVYEEPVTVDVPLRFEVSGVAVGEDGTAVQALSDALDSIQQQQ